MAVCLDAARQNHKKDPPMTSIDRRSLLRGAAAAGLTTVLPDAIKNALAIPANSVTGTIQDVQHIVVLMQENRSFDHYFGTLRGVPK